MKISEAEILAKTFNVSVRTIQKWESKNAPLDDMSKMDAWIADQRRRRGVSKNSKKIDAEIVTTGESAAVIEADIVLPAVDAASDDGIQSTMSRLERAERLAYERFTQTGNRLDGQFWMLLTDQLRREKLAAGQTQEVADADWQIVRACLQIIEDLIMYLDKPQGFSRVVMMLCEGYEDIPAWQVEKSGMSKLALQREIISKKVEDRFEAILTNAFLDLREVIKGTKLEPLFAKYSYKAAHLTEEDVRNL